ncbi:MAG: IS21 family transposase, partial [Candidatus Rokuibacteriota bacterium]
MIGAMTRHEIQILRAVGMAQTAIAATTGVSVRSVRRIEDEPVVRNSDTAALIRARGVGRPSLAAPWAPTVERWLQEDRTVPSGEIIRRLREDHGYRGGKSAVYELIRRLRPVSVAPLVRFEGVPGEFSQHDFGMVSVRYVTGVVERVRFFASRLKWSRFVDVTLVPDEREEALIRGLLHALEAFRGVPLVTVWDNPKTVVLARKGALIVWNPVFGQVALDYRFAPELCWPRAGQQKGAVENLVGWVKKSFFTCRRFHDRADLEQQLRAWLRMVNTERPNRATGIIPAVRLAEEQRRLRPLPIAADAYALKYAVVVSARARVSHAGHEYSMPPAAIGQAATLHLYEERVEILTKTGLVIRHPRRAAAASLLPEHRAAMLDAVRGARGRLYFQRQSLWELGRPAEAWLTELIHRR